MWALIQDSKVVEITELDPSGRYHAALHWQTCPLDVQPGWTYNGATFAAPSAYVPTTEELCQRVDAAADRARHKVAGDPLRAVEYERAAKQAADFANASYQGPVPDMVAAWVTPNRSAEQAADEIISEAIAYNAALTQLRTVRLQAKEQIRALFAAEQIEQAQALAEQTVAAIEAAVAGIGNNA